MSDVETGRTEETEKSTPESPEGEEDTKVDSKPPPVPAHRPPPSPTHSSSIRLHLQGSLPRTTDAPTPVEPQKIELEDRDPKHINDLVKIQFEDVFAEPDGTHSFDAVWTTSFKVFSATKLWCYRLISAVFAVPCAFCWGLHFACAIFDYNWTVQPMIRSCTIAIKPLGVLWKLCVSSFLDPCFESVGRVFSNVVINFKNE